MINIEKRRLRNWLKRFGSRFELGFIVTEPTEDGVVVFANETFFDLTGYSLEEIQGESLRFLINQGTDLNLIQEIDIDLSQGIPVNEEFKLNKKDGTSFWAEFVIQPLVNEQGEILYYTSFILDVSERKENESIRELHEHVFIGINQGKKLEDLLQIICDKITAFIPQGGACAYLCKEDEGDWTILRATALLESIVPEIEEKVAFGEIYAEDRALFVNKITPSAEHDYIESWSLPIFSLNGEINELFAVFVKERIAFTDSQMAYLKKLLPIIQMTKTFFEQRNRLEWLAYSDPSTNLPNRHSIIEMLNQKEHQEKLYFVATIQPTEYTSIIDLYGRDAADDLFIQLANRIEKIGVENKCIVGKVSSGTLIVINDMEDHAEADYYANHLKEITAEPFFVAETEMFITLKAGFSISRENCSAEEMLRRADAALTSAHSETGNSIAFYKDLKNQKAAKEMTIVNELFKAIAGHEFDVYLQPKVDLKSREIIGFEALARWYTEELGHVSPGEFIPAAERIGKIIDLEKIILRKVLSWLQKRRQAGAKLYQVAVNISVSHFFHPSFVPVLKKLIAEFDVDPHYLRLEMTESIGLVDFKNAKEIFSRLHNAGFDISIDDFGVGYSSLSYLPKLQVSELKIDRSFINAIDEQDTYAVVTTIIQLANNLRLSTVAEGIEEVHQVEALLALGCQVGQGFYFYKPMPLHEVDLLLK